MIAPDHLLIVALAASLRRRPPTHPRARHDQRVAIARALAAWPRVRTRLFAGVRHLAA